MGDFITFSLILYNKYMFLDDKEKICKIIILYHSAESPIGITFSLPVYNKKLYIHKLASQIIAVAETEISRNTLFANSLGHKNFYDYLQTFWDTQFRRSQK